jgi:ubiquinol-cytochrome c reductase iron-sulfur subunit
MVGSLGVLAASGAKSTVSDILSNMAASADVLALAKIEVEMGSIPEGRSVGGRSTSHQRGDRLFGYWQFEANPPGKNLIVKWRGKPVFIRHRTEDEIAEARAVDPKTLRDPQTDEDRVQRGEW